MYVHINPRKKLIKLANAFDKSKCTFNPIRSGLFQTANDPGGGEALKAPPPLRSRKLLCQSSPYHTCEFCQVF